MKKIYCELTLLVDVVSERLEIRFSQLKSDLFSPQNTLFDVFNFVQELRDGAERHFILKKIFWKVGIFMQYISLFVLMLNRTRLQSTQNTSARFVARNRTPWLLRVN